MFMDEDDLPVLFLPKHVRRRKAKSPAIRLYNSQMKCPVDIMQMSLPEKEKPQKPPEIMYNPNATVPKNPKPSTHISVPSHVLKPKKQHDRRLILEMNCIHSYFNMEIVSRTNYSEVKSKLNTHISKDKLDLLHKKRNSSISLLDYDTDEKLGHFSSNQVKKSVRLTLQRNDSMSIKMYNRETSEKTIHEAQLKLNVLKKLEIERGLVIFTS
jgi:hypothetical protein